MSETIDPQASSSTAVDDRYKKYDDRRGKSDDRYHSSNSYFQERRPYNDSHRSDRHYDDDRSYERRRRPYSPPRRRPNRPVIRGTEEERASTTSLYIGNLPYDFGERDVAELVERYGKLKSIKVPQDRYTGRNKGFAFVEFEDRLDAEDALSKLHDFTVDGRRIKLDWDVGQTKKEEVKEERYVRTDSYRRGRDERDRSPSRHHSRDRSRNNSRGRGRDRSHSRERD